MSEDRLAQLLEEIRDLQRRQLQHQELSIANQQQALQCQRRATRRALPLFLLLLFLMVYGPWLRRWVVYLVAT
jgi:hypothetical protein